MHRLTHLAEDGTAQMVDVSAKNQSAREAVATGAIRLRQATLDLISKNRIGKGNVFATARIAGISLDREGQAARLMALAGLVRRGRGQDLRRVQVRAPDCRLDPVRGGVDHFAARAGGDQVVAC